jgi:hypothetical protein
MSAVTPEAVRLRLLSAKFSPLPCQGKIPLLKQWQHHFKTNPGEIALWSTLWPAATNTGLLTAFAPAFDLDILDPDAAAAVERLVRERFEERGYILVRFGRKPKRAILFRTDMSFAKIQRVLIALDGSEQRLEFLADRQQIIVHGLHPDTREPYSWFGGEPGEVPCADLPYISAEEAAKLADDAARLLVAEHGYRTKSERQPEATPGGGCAGWSNYLANVLDHDALAAFAMALLCSGMQDGAAVNFLRDAVRRPQDVDEARRQRRLDEIPAMVKSARRKHDEEAASPKIEARDKAEESGAEEWPEPRPIVAQLPPVLPFTREMLPEALGAYVFDIADRQQASPDFAAVVAVVAAGATLGNKVRIFPKRHDNWEVVPNPWGVLIGRPSAMKTPSMKAALAPLYKLEETLREAWQNNLDAEAVNEALGKLRSKTAKKQAERETDKGNHEKARSILEEAASVEKEKPPCPRLIVNDTTIPKLGELLNENPRGLLLVRDEIQGWLANMEDERFASDRAFFLESFTGFGSFTHDRIGRGTVHIENCTLAVVGGIQPSRIASLVRGAIGGSQNDGLVQRLQLAIWPDDASTWQWIDRRPAIEAQINYEDVFNRLYKLGRDDRRARFEPGAQTLFREWSTDLHLQALGNRFSAVLESHALKMEKTLVSLALIFEAAESGLKDDLVRTATFERALKWSDYLLGHAQRLYRAADTMAEVGARMIRERRAKLPMPFTARDVRQRGWAGLADMDFVQAALAVLVATHHCRVVASPIRTIGGRPTEQYRWNPKLGESVT